MTESSIGVIESTPKDQNLERYCEVLDCVEQLIIDHLLHQNSGLPELSRLSQLVPTIGRFFTPLPLRQAFVRNDKIRSIASRRFVPPSFNDIRQILNTAQVMAIAGELNLITFDGDMTLYADGADFARDSELLELLLGLLKRNIHVAIVTAAGYAGDAARYEQRLSGLLEGMKDPSFGLSSEQKARFWILGGECNYLFRYDPTIEHLVYIPEETYQTPAMRKWSTNIDRITDLLNVGQRCMEEVMEEMGIEERVKIIRKERAVGAISAGSEGPLAREQLDEFALAVQRRLRNYQHAKLIKDMQQQQVSLGTNDEGSKPTGSNYEPVPFCAFNGGSDVWLDIGNKLIGVQVLQSHLQMKPQETLHVGDQFLSTGNDILTRSCACTVWITSPKETADVLTQLRGYLDEAERRA
jgi:IMP and pyridine-specific 5'-nucleotidase